MVYCYTFFIVTVFKFSFLVSYKRGTVIETILKVFFVTITNQKTIRLRGCLH